MPRFRPPPAALALLAAGVTETAWIAGVRDAQSPGAWAATACAVAASLALALRATRRWSASTVYILFTALGTLGAAGLDWAARGQPPSLATAGCLIALIVGIAGLQRTANEP